MLRSLDDARRTELLFFQCRFTEGGIGRLVHGKAVVTDLLP